MNQFRRSHVIMLPTKNRPCLLNLTLNNKLHLWNTNGTTYNPNGQHLYITSDDEIKEGDWIKLNFELEDGFIYQLIKKEKYHSVLKPLKTGKIDNYSDQFTYKKIIATTDTLLTIKHQHSPYLRDWNLPQPSQQFIEKYIESYNKGEVITDVLVEYENYFRDAITGIPPRKSKVSFPNEFRPVTNAKDNTITIKKLKDSWNREEVIELLTKLSLTTIYSKDDIHCWIKENL